MTKLKKKRAGLQKKVSSVFEGVPIPGSKHGGRSRRMPSPQRSAASPPPKPSNSRIHQDPVATRLDQSEESVARTVPAHFMAAFNEGPQNPDVEKADKLEDVADTTVPESVAATAPPASTDSEGPQSRDAEKADEPKETVEKTAPEYIAATAPPASTDSEGPQSRDAEKAEESADETASEHIAASPRPKPVERQSSQSSLIRRLDEYEESLDKPAPIKAEETSRIPAPVKTTGPSRKPAPAKRPASYSFAETSGSSLGQQIRDKLVTSRLGTGATKDKVMVLLVPILAIIMVFAFRQVFFKSPGKAKGAAKDSAPTVATADAGDEIEWELPEPMPASMRDPTQLPSRDDTQSPASDNTQKPKRNGATGKTQTTAMCIRGLVYSEDRSSVVIGDRIAHVGDKINGVTIARINKDCVEFEKDGETWVQRVRD